MERVFADARQLREDLDSLKVYIGRLRRKLEADPQNPRRILTDKNVDYRFAGEETA